MGEWDPDVGYRSCCPLQLFALLGPFGFTRQSVERLIAGCSHDPIEIEHVVANIVDDTQDYDQDPWNEVRVKKKEEKEAEKLEQARPAVTAGAASPGQAAASSSSAPGTTAVTTSSSRRTGGRPAGRWEELLSDDDSESEDAAEEKAKADWRPSGARGKMGPRWQVKS